MQQGLVFAVDLFLFSTFQHDALDRLLGKIVVAVKVLQQKIQFICEELLLRLVAMNADTVSSGGDLKFREIGSNAVEVAIVRTIEVSCFKLFQENLPYLCRAVFLCFGQVFANA